MRKVRLWYIFYFSIDFREFQGRIWRHATVLRVNRDVKRRRPGHPIDPHIYTYTPKLIQYITFIPHDPTLSCRRRPSLVGLDDDGPPIAHAFSPPRRVAFISKEHAYPTYYYRSSVEHMESATMPFA